MTHTSTYTHTHARIRLHAHEHTLTAWKTHTHTHTHTHTLSTPQHGYAKQHSPILYTQTQMRNHAAEEWLIGIFSHSKHHPLFFPWLCYVVLFCKGFIWLDLGGYFSFSASAGMIKGYLGKKNHLQQIPMNERLIPHHLPALHELYISGRFGIEEAGWVVSTSSCEPSLLKSQTASA